MRKLKQSQVKEYRDEMLKDQDGECSFCGQECKKPCLDHAHMEPYKYKVRGVICNWCNIAIGKLENSKVRTGTSWDDFKASFPRVYKYVWNIQTVYDPEGYDSADWHPSKRKSEVTEFRGLTAPHQVYRLQLMGIILGIDLTNPKYECKNATQRVALFKKLNTKT